MLDLTGRTIGPYQILDRLGADAQSRLYKARHQSTGRLVALALSAPGASPDAGTQEQFRRQATALAGLQHPNIVPTVDSGADRGFYFLAADFVEGSDLRRVLQEQRQQNRRLGAQQIARIIAAVGNALDYAHGREVLHLDVRPANILFGPDDRVLLAGFGRAWLAGLTPQPRGEISPYRSPEQAGRAGVDTRADLYALSVVLYEMLSGQVPAATGSEPALPPGFGPIVQKALAPSPTARYQTAAELVAAVQQAAAPAPLTALPPDAVSRSTTPTPGTGRETEKMIVCPNCQGLNPPGSRFCDQCAFPLGDVPLPGGGAAAWPGLSRAAALPTPPVAPAGAAPTPPPALGTPGPAPAAPSPPPIRATPPGAGAQASALLPDVSNSLPASPPSAGPPATGVPIPPTPSGPAPGAARPARRRDPVLLMIGGALAALALFLVVGVAALVFSSGATPTPTPGATSEVGQLKTQLAEQANQVAATQTVIALGNGTATARLTALAQESVVAGAIQATSAALAAQPTATPAGAPASATAVAVATVLPTATDALVAVLPGLPTATPTGIVSVSAADLPGEIKAYFTTFYEARTLAPGGHFDLTTIHDITASPYREYTLNLLQQNQADVDAGKLQQITYSNISVQVMSQGTDANNIPTVLVQLTRTVNEVRAGSPPAPQTGTYQFRLRRLPQPLHGVVWQAYDFYNAATNTWISGGS